jgi:hypothetical protein
VINRKSRKSLRGFENRNDEKAIRSRGETGLLIKSPVKQSPDTVRSRQNSKIAGTVSVVQSILVKMCGSLVCGRKVCPISIKTIAFDETGA